MGSRSGSFMLLGLGCWILTACSSALSTLPEPAPDDTADGASSADASNGGFFDCGTLDRCKSLCDGDDPDGCMGAYMRSDKNDEAQKTAARAYLEKACKLGAPLSCGMLEPDTPDTKAPDAPSPH